MLKILTKQSCEAVMTRLGVDMLRRLGNLYDTKIITKRDRMVYPFESFISDLISESAYRDACGEPDDNWREIANDYNLTESDFEAILKAMTNSGYSKDNEKW